MSSSDKEGSSTSAQHKQYKGIRQRKWGKWVSEIRVPGTRERLWLGSYSTPEAAAVAHDIAYYCLRGPSFSPGLLNFPLMLPSDIQAGMSPSSIQKAASDAGMAIDAQMAMKQPSNNVDQVNESNVICGLGREIWSNVEDRSGSWERISDQLREGEEALSISIEDYL